MEPHNHGYDLKGVWVFDLFKLFKLFKLFRLFRLLVSFNKLMYTHIVRGPAWLLWTVSTRVLVYSIRALVPGLPASVPGLVSVSWQLLVWVLKVGLWTLRSVAIRMLVSTFHLLCK